MSGLYPFGPLGDSQRVFSHRRGTRRRIKVLFRLHPCLCYGVEESCRLCSVSGLGKGQLSDEQDAISIRNVGPK